MGAQAIPSPAAVMLRDVDRVCDRPDATFLPPSPRPAADRLLAVVIARCSRCAERPGWSGRAGDGVARSYRDWT
jgi:hypothetical protein